MAALLHDAGTVLTARVREVYAQARRWCLRSYARVGQELRTPTGRSSCHGEALLLACAPRIDRDMQLGSRALLRRKPA